MANFHAYSHRNRGAMTSLRIALARAVVATLALIAAGAAVSRRAEDSTAKALAAVQRACAQMQYADYDAAYTSSHGDEMMRGSARFSGASSHISGTLYIQGNPTGKFELITVDGVAHSRETLPGRLQVYGNWAIVGTGLSPQPSLPCARPDNFVSGSDDAGSERHYTSTHSRDSLSGGSPDTVTDELWVDSSGRPTRSKTTTLRMGDGEESGTLVEEQTYSGYGETNVITAPTLPTPTATPSPTPTAAP